VYTAIIFNPAFVPETETEELFPIQNGSERNVLLKTFLEEV
jgi:hypothetical protein